MKITSYSHTNHLHGSSGRRQNVPRLVKMIIDRTPSLHTRTLPDTLDCQNGRRHDKQHLEAGSSCGGLKRSKVPSCQCQCKVILKNIFVQEHNNLFYKDREGHQGENGNQDRQMGKKIFGKYLFLIFKTLPGYSFRRVAR